ncbi:MAG: hypothetical protein QW228_07450 [Candidatus Aenigmatarchaeota archaeon]
MEMGNEKLVVEFGVEKEIDVGYGLKEKFLMYNGEKIDYKAIVKGNTVVALVKRGYKLIPNELFIETIRKLGYEVNDGNVIWDGNTRVAVLIREGEDGIMLTNSIDGSLAIQAFLIPKTMNTMIKINVVYRRHTKNLNFVSEMKDFIDEAKRAMKEYKEFLVAMERMEVSGERIGEIVDILTDARMPQKYLQGVKYLTMNGTITTLKQVYEKIAKNIMSNNKIELRTKITLFNKLNDVFMTLVAMKQI